MFSILEKLLVMYSCIITFVSEEGLQLSFDSDRLDVVCKCFTHHMNDIVFYRIIQMCLEYYKCED